MGNILYQRSQNPIKKRNNSFIDALSSIKSMGPSNAAFNQMYQNNPEFRKFADSVKGLSPEEAFSRNGLNFNNFKNLRW